MLYELTLCLWVNPLGIYCSALCSVGFTKPFCDALCSELILLIGIHQINSLNVIALKYEDYVDSRQHKKSARYQQQVLKKRGTQFSHWFDRNV